MQRSQLKDDQGDSAAVAESSQNRESSSMAPSVEKDGDMFDEETDDHSKSNSAAEDGDSSALREKLQFSLDPSINTADVLCGRGKQSFNHAGNKSFRDAISSSLETYMQAETRFEKAALVHKIVDDIRQKGGRFLKKNMNTGKWIPLNEQHAREKVGHAIRDALCAFESKQNKQKKKELAALDFRRGGLLGNENSPAARSPSSYSLSHTFSARLRAAAANAALHDSFSSPPMSGGFSPPLSGPSHARRIPQLSGLANLAQTFPMLHAGGDEQETAAQRSLENSASDYLSLDQLYLNRNLNQMQHMQTNSSPFDQQTIAAPPPALSSVQLGHDAPANAAPFSSARGISTFLDSQRRPEVFSSSNTMPYQQQQQSATMLGRGMLGGQMSDAVHHQRSSMDHDDQPQSTLHHQQRHRLATNPSIYHRNSIALGAQNSDASEFGDQRCTSAPPSSARSAIATIDEAFHFGRGLRSAWPGVGGIMYEGNEIDETASTNTASSAGYHLSSGMGCTGAPATLSGTNDEQCDFLEKIDSVLGPLPPDAEDPMARYLVGDARRQQDRM